MYVGDPKGEARQPLDEVASGFFHVSLHLWFADMEEGALLMFLEMKHSSCDCRYTLLWLRLD